MDRTTGLQVPKPERNAAICLGIVNFIFFGCGTIVGGIMTNEMADVVIGLCQLFIPFVGWIWSIVWGVLMVLDK